MRTDRLVLAAAGIALIWMPVASTAPPDKHGHTDSSASWSYTGATGPEHWGDLDPQYAACKEGREQSPIDIEATQKAALPKLGFAYHSGPVRIINNAHTAVRVNYPRGNGNFLIVGDKRYELTQFHFHRPSEEQVHGKAAEMVLHLMHTASDGKVAAVAVLLQKGAANPTIARLWQHMPPEPGEEQLLTGVEINPAGLLPQGSAYYTYMGSLTAPPCTEGVQWFVLKDSAAISTEQIGAFAKLYPHDVRPLQPVNGREVQERE